jgi:hypothetical protein
MSNTPITTREDSLKERALQILNLRYPIEPDIKSSYKSRIFECHPDRHPEAKENSAKLLEYENKIKVINQAYELVAGCSAWHPNKHKQVFFVRRYWFGAVNFARERETCTVR